MPLQFVGVCQINLDKASNLRFPIARTYLANLSRFSLQRGRRSCPMPSIAHLACSDFHTNSNVRLQNSKANATAISRGVSNPTADHPDSGRSPRIRQSPHNAVCLPQPWPIPTLTPYRLMRASERRTFAGHQAHEISALTRPARYQSLILCRQSGGPYER